MGASRWGVGDGRGEPRCGRGRGVLGGQYGWPEIDGDPGAAAATYWWLQPTLIAINPVLADHADGFEDWLRTIAVPASRKYRPDQEGRWEILRAAEQEDGTVVFAFIFRGGDPAEWNLEELLDQALGREGAQRALADLHRMLKREQTSWFFTPVKL